MSAHNVRHQSLFVAVYACCILLIAGTMSLDNTDESVLDGMTKSERFVCTSCEQRRLPGFFIDKRACKIHITKSKRCNGAAVKKVTVLTRPGDVIAGGTAAMGQIPNVQHQPQGI